MDVSDDLEQWILTLCIKGGITHYFNCMGITVEWLTDLKLYYKFIYNINTRYEDEFGTDLELKDYPALFKEINKSFIMDLKPKKIILLLQDINDNTNKPAQIIFYNIIY